MTKTRFGGWYNDSYSNFSGRSAEDLEQMLLFGSLDDSLGKIRNLVDAGVKPIHFWPVLDYEDQICVFKEGISTEL